MKRLFILTACLGCLMTNMRAQTEHVVQRGETLEGIAQRYGVTIDNIKKANPSLKVAYAGKRLTIPAASATAATASAPAATPSTNSMATAAPAAKAPAPKPTPTATKAPATASTTAHTEPATPAAEPATPATAPATPDMQPIASRYQGTGMLSDKERYRRSSLCLIMLTHRDKKYAQGMERVFKNFPLPLRYNEHNISDLRVIAVKGKQTKADIDKIVNSNYVAQKVVGRWFNRSPYTGYMNMDLIHERGGYGAFYADYQRSQSNVRGTAMLRDEGIELLQSTFVLVCDMDYYDQSKTSRWGALGLALMGVASGVASEVNRQKGNKEAANQWEAASNLSMAGANVVADIGGFRVKMNAYLYKLKWDDNMTQTMYSQYWTDSETPASETASRKAKFDADKRDFSLDYVGMYSESSTKTILKSWRNEDEVILDVCHRCVQKGMRELAREFPIFRPRAPFYFEGGSMYSHIGRKEDVTFGKEYEIIQPYKDKNGQICYKRVAKAKAGTPWDNQEIRFDQYFDVTAKGTAFECGHSSVDLHSPGLQLREL